MFSLFDPGLKHHSTLLKYSNKCLLHINGAFK